MQLNRSDSIKEETKTEVKNLFYSHGQLGAWIRTDLKKEEPTFSNQKPEQKNHFLSKVFTYLKLKMRLEQLVNNLSSRQLYKLCWRQMLMLNDFSIIYDRKTSRLEDLYVSDNETVPFQSQRKQPSHQQSNRDSIQYNFNQASQFTAYLNSITMKSRIQKSIKTLTSFYHQLPVFDPSSKFKIAWDIMQLINILITAVILPLYLSSGVSFDALLPFSIIYVIIIINILDILINLNTGYFEQGQQVTKKLKIIKNYLKTNIYIDIVSICPMFIHFCCLSSRQKNRLLSIDKLSLLLFLVKMHHFGHILKKIQERFLLSPNTTNLISLVKLLGTMLFVCHLFGCSWVFIGEVQMYFNSDEKTWIVRSNIDNNSISNIYLHSLYFSLVTMSTVGYGDITPSSNAEILWSLFAILGSSCMFAYCINTIGQILSEFSKKESEIRFKIFMINNYMEKKNVNSALKHQIREYLEYYWLENDLNDTQFQENIINKQLSKALREELLIDSNRIILKDSPIFKLNFSIDVITKTVNVIRQSTSTPEEKILVRGDLTESIYFIEKGQVDIILEGGEDERQVCQRNHRVIKTLGKGDCFCINEFFTGQISRYSVISKDFCKLLSIKREEFLQVIKDYPDDYERFCYIKDNIMLYDSTDLLQSKCLSCFKTNHQTQFCPQLHYIPKKDVIIRSYVYHTTKQRSIFPRKKANIHTKGVKLEQQYIYGFQDDNKEFLEYYCQIYEIQQREGSQSIIPLEDELASPKLQEWNCLPLLHSARSNKNREQEELEYDLKSEKNDRTKDLEIKFITEMAQKDGASSSDGKRAASHIENQYGENKNRQINKQSSFVQKNQNLKEKQAQMKEASIINDSSELEFMMNGQSKSIQFTQQADQQQHIGSQRRILEPQTKGQRKQINENKNQLRNNFTKTVSSQLLQHSPSKLIARHPSNIQDIREQIFQMKEVLYGQMKDIQKNIEEEFDVLKNFEFYFPLNNLNFILTTLNLEKGERKWFTFKYFKIYNDVYNNKSYGQQSFNRLKKKNPLNFILPHSYTPQAVNSPTVFKHKKSDYSSETNSLKKSMSKKFTQEQSSLFKSRSRQLRSICNYKERESDKVIQNSSILNQSSIISAGGFQKHKKTTLVHIQDNNFNNGNTLSQSQFRKSLNGSHIQTNSQYLSSNNQFNGDFTRTMDFDENEIQIEFEQNITQAQQLEVIYPIIKRTISAKDI